ncbi:MAG TPA: histidine kinase [Chitinophagaceae bacterium]|nr:histidine kinase [Chitinophagaceae bacterium]
MCLFWSSADARQVPSTHYTVRDHLPSNICYRILQDGKGYILVATEKGMARFDGYSFTPLFTKNALPTLDVWGIFQDQHDRIWLKSKLSNSQFIYRDSVYDFANLAPICKQLEVKMDYQGIPCIYNPNPKDLAVYDLNAQLNLIRIPVSNEFKLMMMSGHVLHYSSENDKLHLILDYGKMVTYHVKTHQLLERNFAGSLSTMAYSNDVNRHYYFRVEDSVFSVSNQQLSFVNTLSKLGFGNSVRWIGGGSQSLFFLDGDRLFATDLNLQVINLNLPQITSHYSQVFEDVEKNLWFVTVEDGLYFVSQRALESELVNKSNGLSNDHILTLRLTKNGRLYLGTYAQPNIEYIENGVIGQIQKKPTNVRSMLTFDNGDILVSNEFISKFNYHFTIKDTQVIEKPINRFNKGHYITDLRISAKASYKIDEQHFVLGGESAIYFYEQKGNEICLERKISLQGVVYDIASFRQQILFATTMGVYSFRQNKLTYLGEKYPFLSHYSRALVVDQNNLAWLSDDIGGVCCFDSSYHRMAVVHELANLSTTSLYADVIHQTIYASTNNGLYEIKPSLGDQLKYTLHRFTTADGLASNEVNSVQTDSARIYVATSSGLSILPQQRNLVPYTPRIYCTRFLVNNQSKPLSETYSLSYKERNIRIELTCLSYQSLGSITYYYRIKESGNDWVATQQRVFEYSELEPGDYTFEAYARDVNGIKTGNSVTIHVKIIPPFWQTTLFKFIAISLILVTAFGLFYRRFQRKREKEIREIEFKRERAELTLTALQSQLNSHFIFNSLNAIQNFIFNHDEITASEYMSKFARLIRLYLESSRTKLGSIQTEIELLKNYTDLERLRFDHKFDVQIESDKVTNLQTQFPTNMIQPFVENAILHGLLHQPQRGLLVIRFEETSSSILCTVDDNGVGREKSMEINNKKKRTSLGMQIIQDKVVTIDHLSANKMKIEIKDYSMEKDQRTGTCVKLIYSK